ncbi:tigger transposable element-derived protein 1 [Trichonephila clavipes]|nr:tigger transposable element-derived protein 1 [Trichonephila clavipes]
MTFFQPITNPSRIKKVPVHGAISGRRKESTVLNNDFIWPNGEKKKHQRQSISLETKIAILDRLGKGEGSTAIGKHFNLGESTVRAIKKNEAAIRKSVISGTKLSTKFASYTRDVVLERTERAIVIWMEEQVQRRIPVSGYLIQEKALQFYKSMKQPEPSTSTSQAGKEFSVSKGWLTRFLKRNALHNIKITGERERECVCDSRRRSSKNISRGASENN